jgi:hypothetical protein
VRGEAKKEGHCKAGYPARPSLLTAGHPCPRESNPQSQTSDPPAYGDVRPARSAKSHFYNTNPLFLRLDSLSKHWKSIACNSHEPQWVGVIYPEFRRLSANPIKLD